MSLSSMRRVLHQMFHNAKSVRSSRKPKKSPRPRPLVLEYLEARLAPAVLDLTGATTEGMIGGAIFRAAPPVTSAGTGNLQPFVRIDGGAIEQVYNTGVRPVQFDEGTNTSWTHAQLLSGIPPVIASNGLAYYEFVLDINQKNSSPDNLLSLDELRVYVHSDPLAHSYDPTTLKLSTGTGLVSPSYDMDGGLDSSDATFVKLDGNKSSGSGGGTADLVLLVPATALGFVLPSNTTTYVTLYSKFGVKNANNSGFEEWSRGTDQPAEVVGSISGLKFNDLNANGVQDAGEGPIAGVTMFLDANGNGVLDSGEATSATNVSGNFTFSNLLPGTYKVREVVPAGIPANHGASRRHHAGGRAEPHGRGLRQPPAGHQHRQDRQRVVGARGWRRRPIGHLHLHCDQQHAGGDWLLRPADDRQPYRRQRHDRDGGRLHADVRGR